MAVQKIPQTYVDNNAAWVPLRTVANKVNEVIDAIEIGTGLDLVANSVTSTTTVVAGTSIAVGTALTVGTDETFAKQVNHTISVDTSTTVATVGGSLSVTSGIGATSGAGGALNLFAGSSGNTVGSTGGAILVQSGTTGATSGNTGSVIVQSPGAAGTGVSGAVTLRSGAATSSNSGNVSITTGQSSTLGNSGTINIITGDSATSGNSGPININTGAATSGVGGNIVLNTGTSSSVTVAPTIFLNKSVVKIPTDTSVTSGGTITAVQLLNGHITATGATGNYQLPSAANLITALGGSVSVGTNFEFVFNATSMTATNTATLVVGVNMSVMSAPAITGGGSLTVTQNTQVVGLFRVIFDSTSTCKISRIS